MSSDLSLPLKFSAIFSLSFFPCVIILLVYFILLETKSAFFVSHPLPNVLPVSSPDYFLQEIPSLKLLLILFYVISFSFHLNSITSVPGNILSFIFSPVGFVVTF